MNINLWVTGKYFGKTEILQVAKEEKLICIGLLMAFAGILIIPIVMAAVIYMFRGSPIMTPSFKVKGVYEGGPIDPKFCHALAVADAVAMWVGIEGVLFLVFMVAMPLIGIASLLRSLRYEHSQYVNHAR